MKVIDPYIELLSYYHFDFNIYYMSMLVIFINTLKTIKCYSEKTNVLAQYCDLLTTLILIVGMVGGLIFQGAFIDISATNDSHWFIRLVIIFIVSLLLFFIQLISIFKSKNKA